MPGTGKKMLMWLGLADAEEYDDYEAYDEAPAPQVATARRGGEVLETVPQSSPAVRTLPRDGHEVGAPINLRAAPTQLRSLPTTAPAPRVHVATTERRDHISPAGTTNVNVVAVRLSGWVTTLTVTSGSGRASGRARTTLRDDL